MKIARMAALFVLPLIALMAVLTYPAARATDPGLPAVGALAPDFTLKSQEAKIVSLHDFRGKWVVLYFYPKDMTQGCTIEAHNFQRDLPMYDKKNAVILGVSVDSVDSHVQFCTKESLTFRLLSDESHEVTTKYGSLTKMRDMTIAARNTFLIDPKGVIQKVYEKVNPNPHSTEVLATLDQFQKGSSE